MGRPTRIISILVFLVFLFWMAGCSWGQATNPFAGSGSWTSNPPTPETPTSALGVLNWTAGLSMIGGMISMVLTKSTTGIRAVFGGMILIVLSFVISAYAALILIPVGIVMTIVSASWGYLTIARAWRQRQ